MSNLLYLLHSDEIQSLLPILQHAHSLGALPAVLTALLHAFIDGVASYSSGIIIPGPLTTLSSSSSASTLPGSTSDNPPSDGAPLSGIDNALLKISESIPTSDNSPLPSNSIRNTTSSAHPMQLTTNASLGNLSQVSNQTAPSSGPQRTAKKTNGKTSGKQMKLMNSKPDLRRGGEVVQTAWSVSETPATMAGKEAIGLLAELSLGKLSHVSEALDVGASIPDEPSVALDWIQTLRSFVNADTWAQEQTAFYDNSMDSIIMHCTRSTHLKVALEFVTIINFMQLAAKVDSIIQTTGNTKGGTAAVYRSHVQPLVRAPHEVTFRKWVAAGTKYATLAGAGTVYFLMIIAVHEKRTHVGKLQYHVVEQIANTLRWPNIETSMGRNVVDHIIPLVNRLRKMMPLEFGSIFPPALLEQHRLPSTIQCAPSPLSDLGEDETNYSQDTADAHHTFEDAFLPSPTSTIIKTNLDLRVPVNKHFPAPTTGLEHSEWSVLEQDRAGKAVNIGNVEDLQCKLQHHYIDGHCIDKTYIKVNQSLIKDWVLHFKNQDNSLLALVLGTIPQRLKNSLTDGLTGALSSIGGASLIDIDTSQSDRGLPIFSAIHFCCYNGNNMKGDKALDNVQPLHLQRVGVSRTNHFQLLPRASKELMQHTKVYERLCVVFEGLFEWVGQAVAEHLPETYKNLMMYTDVLPGKESSPAYPFTSMVINLNVCTRAHRNPKDMDICVVIALGDFKGGELCLFKPGLVLELCPGEAIIFHLPTSPILTPLYREACICST